MKLKLPILLLHAVLLSQSALAIDILLDSESPRQDYTVETTVKATGDSLVYTQWQCPDVHNPDAAKKKGAIFNSTENLNFNGEYSLTISGGRMQSLGGFIYSKKDISFSGMKDITMTNNVIEVGRSPFKNGIINAFKNMIFSDVGNIVVMGIR